MAQVVVQTDSGGVTLHEGHVVVLGGTALSLHCFHLHGWEGAAGGLWWAAATAGDSPLCPQTTASPSSVPSSLLHVSKVSSIFGARPPQPRENVLGISFKPYSPESGPAPSPCSACESTRKDGLIHGPAPSQHGEGWREAGMSQTATGCCFPGL